MKKFLCLSVLIFSAIASFAFDKGEEFVVDNLKYMVLSNDSVSVVGYETQPSGDLNIPATVTYDSHPFSVEKIGDGAFVGCQDITSLTLPNTLTTVGINSFCDCKELKEVTIPNSVTYIGEGSFARTKLSRVDIPNSVTFIGHNAFLDCDRLKWVHLSDSLTYIGIGAFARTALTSVIIPNSVKTIADGGFGNCPNLKYVKMPAKFWNRKFSIFGRNGTIDFDLVY